MLNTWKEQARAAAEELCDAAGLREGDLLAVGCSSSEIIGARIGTQSSEEAASAVFQGIAEALAPRGVLLAAQCCEHLNRALIVEQSTAERFGLTPVNAPAAVEELRQQAKAGLDIGATLIGMHVRPVVVPVRLSTGRIGQAAVTAARSRPKFVGGSRAVYDEKLL